MSRYIKVLVRTATVGGSVAATSIYLYSKEKYEKLKEGMNSLDEYREKIRNFFKNNMLNKDGNKVELHEAIIEKLIQNNLAFTKENEPPPLPNNLNDDIDQMNEDQLRKRLEEIIFDSIEKQKKSNSRIKILEQEIEELKKEINSIIEAKITPKQPRRKNIVEMYGEILDILSNIDTKSNGITDSLPRIVVVGDQSSGKTSVLELIVKAHVFPRGAGEMMTRSPVMLTMCEGSKHIASFRNENKVYSLDSETDLQELRGRIEKKMLESVKSGKTISSEVISINMSGPGIPRMILVDLPGIINTVTSDMSSDAKDSIVALARTYMSNPNSIILCIQDGSVDAERSLVTELVSSIDPSGARTLCVLTKMDLAEKNNVKTERIQKLLSGKLFPMKAMNYFAVIAGTGNNNDSVNKILAYEEDFFKHSALFRDGLIKPTQVNSQNLINTITHCFWDLVKQTVELESDALRSRLFALEAEWRHSFPNLRELDRDELMEKSKADILDGAISFSNTNSKEWETLLANIIWKSLIPYAFRDIYLKNAISSSKIGFQTQVEILSRTWLENKVTNVTIEAAKNVMIERLKQCLEKSNQQHMNDTYKELFKPIKNAIIDECKNNFHWLENNSSNLKIIQKSALSDTTVNERSDWDQACSFMENIIIDEETEVNKSLNQLMGPSKTYQWVTWSSVTPDQLTNQKVAGELTKLLLHRDNNFSPKLTSSEISMIAQNLNNEGIIVKPDVLNLIWDNLYLQSFYKQTINGIHDCRKSFRSGEFSQHPLGCNDIVLFYKIHKLLQHTVSTLRQQINSQESRRMENFIKDTLDKYSSDERKKMQLFTGKQVDLAVEIKKIAEVRQKLDRFIELLLRETY